MITEYKNITLKYKPRVSLISKPTLIWDNFKDHLIELAQEMNECGENTPEYKIVSGEPSGTSDAANLCEIAGRLCYMSFNDKMGRNNTEEYIDHIKKVKHKSVLYHANFTFLISGISRRLSLELNRHIIGVSRSQLSTRFVPHNGSYIVHPKLKTEKEITQYAESCAKNYQEYLEAVKGWDKEKGLARKRILEAGSNVLLQGAETAIVVTYNVESFSKMYYERSAEPADLEFQQLVKYMANEITKKEPILFKDIYNHMRQ